MDYEFLHAVAVDLNGNFRGKRLPGEDLAKVEAGALRMPISVLSVDIAGADVADSPLVFETGDQDGVLRPTGRGPLPMPWLASNTGLVLMEMFEENGTAFDGDARHALTRVLEGYGARGWQVVAATEMEFHLVDDRGETLTPASCPRSGRPLEGPEILSATQLEVFDPFLTDLAQGAAAMGLNVASLTIESGVGQFEVTLKHGDAMKAADDAALFKVLARGTARAHGMAATFMAKPFADDAGNGMHMHFSILDENGRNVFDDGGEAGTDTLRAAIAGCLEMMPEATLVFAPHANSYARLVPGAHAPTGASWGYENRTVALRVPGGPPQARRIEHRVAGGDVNPYLLFAVVLGGALDGIARALTPPPPITGNAYAEDLPQMAADWASAIDRAQDSEALARILPDALIRNFVLTKRQELALMAARGDAPDWRLLLETV
ncbi:glutamine synthetase family protein [Roseobacteraceae bacterium S113]